MKKYSLEVRACAFAAKWTTIILSVLTVSSAFQLALPGVVAIGACVFCAWLLRD